MGQQVGLEPDLLLEVNDFTLIFPSFFEMIWLTVWEKQIPLFVNTKSISWLTALSLTAFLLAEQGLPSATEDRTNRETGPCTNTKSASAVVVFGNWQLSCSAHKFTFTKPLCHDSPVGFPRDCVRGISLCKWLESRCKRSLLWGTTIVLGIMFPVKGRKRESVKISSSNPHMPRPYNWEILSPLLTKGQTITALLPFFFVGTFYRTCIWLWCCVGCWMQQQGLGVFGTT